MNLSSLRMAKTLTAEVTGKAGRFGGFELDGLKCHTEAAAIESPIIGTDEMASILRKNEILSGKEFFSRHLN